MYSNYGASPRVLGDSQDITPIKWKARLQGAENPLQVVLEGGAAHASEELRPYSLEASYVGGLEALGARGHFEFNSLPFVQRLVTVRLNRGKMYKDVLAGLALDETITLARVKPLHGALFFHKCSSTLSLKAI